MQVRVITLRYEDGIQGFPEDALRQAASGSEILEVREHFFVHGNVPHLSLLLLLADGSTQSGRGKHSAQKDPGHDLPEHLRKLYADMKRWRNERARQDGVPSYVIARNVQLVEICRTLPRSLSGLKEIEGIGESTCNKYGKELLSLIPENSNNMPAEGDEPGEPEGGIERENGGSS